MELAGAVRHADREGDIMTWGFSRAYSGRLQVQVLSSPPVCRSTARFTYRLYPHVECAIAAWLYVVASANDNCPLYLASTATGPASLQQLVSAATPAIAPSPVLKLMLKLSHHESHAPDIRAFHHKSVRLEVCQTIRGLPAIVIFKFESSDTEAKHAGGGAGGCMRTIHV